MESIVDLSLLLLHVHLKKTTTKKKKPTSEDFPCHPHFSIYRDRIYLMSGKREQQREKRGLDNNGCRCFSFFLVFHCLAHVEAREKYKRKHEKSKSSEYRSSSARRTRRVWQIPIIFFSSLILFFIRILNDLFQSTLSKQNSSQSDFSMRLTWAVLSLLSLSRSVSLCASINNESIQCGIKRFLEGSPNGCDTNETMIHEMCRHFLVSNSKHHPSFFDQWAMKNKRYFVQLTVVRSWISFFFCLL